MRIAVFINPAAGGSQGQPQLGDRIRSLFSRHSLSAEIFPISRLDEFSLPAPQSATLLVAAGGDGTVSSVAETCVRGGLPLGVLPLGTWNNFARDSGIPLELEDAIACIAANNRRRIDAAAVNDLLFINNSSIGAYPRSVHERKELQSRVPLSKRPAMVIAVLRVFHSKPLLATRIDADGRSFHRFTPFVFVGNNDYSIHSFSPRLRPALNRGRLCLVTARSTGIGGFCKLLWLTLTGQADDSTQFEKYLAEEITIHLPSERVRVSRDGEVAWMNVPLRYKIKKKALELIVP